VRDAFSAIWHTLSMLLGITVFLFVIWTVAHLHSRMWRRVAEGYRGTSSAPRTGRKVPETIIIADRGPIGPSGYRVYATASIAVHEDGLQLSQVPPFNIMCPTVFLPFDEIELVQTEWALWPQPMAVRMRRLPGVDIILARDTVQWIRSQTDRPPLGWD